MHEIRHVAVLGAGAMGVLYASHFADKEGFQVSLVARGERAARLRGDGLLVNGEPVPVTVLDADALDRTVAPADLVIVAVKHRHLEAALEDVAALVARGTLFLSVLNGLDSEERIARRFGPDKVLYCIALGMDAMRDGNRVRFTRPGTLHFGEARNESPAPRVVRVQRALDRAGLAWETPVEMLRAMWWKFMVNVGVNQASAIMRADYGACRSDPDARWLMERLMDEVVAVSVPAGIALDATDIARWNEVLAALSADGKTSMLQDVEAGRPTEVDVFAARVIAIGREHGVPTPVNEAAYHVIRRVSRLRG